MKYVYIINYLHQWLLLNTDFFTILNRNQQNHILKVGIVHHHLHRIGCQFRKGVAWREGEVFRQDCRHGVGAGDRCADEGTNAVARVTSEGCNPELNYCCNKVAGAQTNVQNCFVQHEERLVNPALAVRFVADGLRKRKRRQCRHWGVGYATTDERR